MRWKLAIVGFLVATLAVVAVPAEAQGTPTPSPSPSPVTEEPDPSFFDVGGRMRSAISGWFSDLVGAALDPVFELLGKTVFSTPEVHRNDRVGDLWRFSIGVANATLVMFVLAGAAVIMTTGGLDLRLTAKEVLPRLLAAGTAANLSWLLIGEMISISNALSAAIFGSIDAEAVGTRMAESLFTGSFPNPFLALLALVVVVLAVLVIVAYVVRVAVLVILAAAAPLMLVTHSLPQTEIWARAWWRSALALLTVPVAQAFLIVAAFKVFLSGDGLLGLTPGGLIDLLVIGCILFLLFKIPFWALNLALGGAASTAWRRVKGVAATASKAAAAA